MTEQIIIKHSKCAVAALIISTTIWIFFGAVFLCWNYLEPFLTMAQCTENDFGPCAMKKLFGPFLAFLLLIILAAIPLTIFAVSTILGAIGYFQKTHKKDFALIALIHNGVIVVLTGLVSSILSMLN